MRKVVIVGCGVAGWSAAFSARKADRNSRVIIIEKEKHPMYERGGIPFVIQGDISEFDALIHFPHKYYEEMKIDLRTETLVKQIDPQSKTVTIIDKRRKEFEIKSEHARIMKQAAEDARKHEELISRPLHEIMEGVIEVDRETGEMISGEE